MYGNIITLFCLGLVMKEEEFISFIRIIQIYQDVHISDIVSR